MTLSLDACKSLRAGHAAMFRTMAARSNECWCVWRIDGTDRYIIDTDAMQADVPASIVLRDVQAMTADTLVLKLHNREPQA